MKSKPLAILLAIVIAVVLWNYVVTTVKTDFELPYYNIPVVLRGESILDERGLMLISGKGTTVDLELIGTRKDLIKINNSDITLIADLSRIYEAGEHRLEYDISLPGSVADNAVSVKSRSPGRITLEVAKRLTTRVPVSVVYSGAVPDGFISDKGASTLDYEFVTVSGPENVVEQIKQAVIRVDLEGRTESFIERYRITLCDAEGEPVDVSMVTVNVEEITLEMKIEYFKTIPLIVNLIDGGGATALTTQVEIEPAELAISGSGTALDDIIQLELGTLNLATITEDTERVFEIELPMGVTNRTGISQATVRISFPELATREILVTSFTPVNLPEGMEANFLTKELRLVFRGPAAEIASLTSESVKVTVDFSGAAAGTTTYEPVVTLPAKFANVGALSASENRISATLAPADHEGE